MTNLTSIIKNADILFGKDLQIIKNGIIVVNNQGIIERAGKAVDVEETAFYSKIMEDKDTKIIDAKGYLIIPGFINSHVHIGDSIGKDICSNADLNTRVHPNYSVKKTILEKTETNQLKQLMKNSAITMLNKGITTFVDFREGGINGINILKTALKDVPIKCIILGRIDFNYSYDPLNKKEIVTKNSIFPNCTKKKNEIYDNGILKSVKELLNSCDGFGISGANENDDEILRLYKNIINETYRQNAFSKKEKPIIAIHAAESIQSVKESLKNTGKTEIERTVLTLEPDVYIHVTNPTRSDLNLLHSTSSKYVVVCPRANGILGVGIVPLKELVRRGFTIAIGTDNIMLNSPDPFKEMDFILKSQRAHEKNISFLDARMVLKMATVNGGKMFNRNIGCIDIGFQADLLFIDEYDIDIYPMHDPYMSVVHRCSERAIKAIMINGKFVHKKYLLS